MFCKPLLLSTFVLTAGALAFAAVQNKEQPKPGGAAAQMPMPQPTAEHKKLQEAVGDWEGTVTSFDMPGQDKPVPAKETVEAIGPFWIQYRFTSDMMGAPYMGTGVLGYDPAKKKYVANWLDNMSPEMAVMEGEMDPKTNALVMRWTGTDHETGKPGSFRYEAVSTGDTHTMTFYKGEGAGTKSMVIALKRKGGKAVPASGQK